MSDNQIQDYPTSTYSFDPGPRMEGVLTTGRKRQSLMEDVGDGAKRVLMVAAGVALLFGVGFAMDAIENSYSGTQIRETPPMQSVQEFPETIQDVWEIHSPSGLKFSKFPKDTLLEFHESSEMKPIEIIHITSKRAKKPVLEASIKPVVFIKPSSPPKKPGIELDTEMLLNMVSIPDHSTHERSGVAFDHPGGKSPFSQDEIIQLAQVQP